ncbi:hypothetical protein ABPG77_002466 [Micractinium sp. CCAP 211/92]
MQAAHAKGETAALRQQNQELSNELAQLKDRLAAAQAAEPAGTQSSNPAQHSAEACTRSKYALEPFDLARFLGQDGLVQGFLFKPKTCLPAWSKGISDEGLLTRMADKMRAELLAQLRPLARNKDAVASDTQLLDTKGISKAMGVTDVDDPLFAQLNLKLSGIVASYMLNQDGSRHCACGQVAQRSAPVTSPDDVGTPGCQDGATVPADLSTDCMGAVSHMLTGEGWSLNDLVEQISRQGICTAQVFQPNFAEWWKKERLYNPEYQNFNVKDKQEDTVLELFDLMYEKKKIFLRQKWMGVSMMQDPFDLLVIQNIIYDLQPDLIIETGTANGGSSLLWASVLEVLGLHNTRQAPHVLQGSQQIHTIDMHDPTVGFGAGNAVANPTQHRLWKKYVTFHQGLSINETIVAAIKTAAQGAKTVMALLDSDHWAGNVANELATYCNTLVTVNSYCIVEDTKLSRMTQTPAPLEAVREFLAKNTGKDGQQHWVADRDRELLYSQHVMGYLKRLA